MNRNCFRSNTKTGGDGKQAKWIGQTIVKGLGTVVWIADGLNVTVMQQLIPNVGSTTGMLTIAAPGITFKHVVYIVSAGTNSVDDLTPSQLR